MKKISHFQIVRCLMYLIVNTQFNIFICYGFHCPIYDKSQHVLLGCCEQKKIATYKSQKIMVSNSKII
jgi:hypothetical protein